MFCPKCGMPLEKAPTSPSLNYQKTDAATCCFKADAKKGTCENVTVQPLGNLWGCSSCDSMWNRKDNEFGFVALTWVCNYTAHLKMLVFTKGGATHVHTHPDMERIHNIPEDHVIIDKHAYIDILRRLAQ